MTMPRRPLLPLAVAQQHLRRSADELVAAAEETALHVSDVRSQSPAAATSSQQRAQPPAEAASLAYMGTDAQRSGAPARMVIVCSTNSETGWVSTRLGGIPVAVYTMVQNISEHRTRCPPGLLLNRLL